MTNVLTDNQLAVYEVLVSALPGYLYIHEVKAKLQEKPNAANLGALYNTLKRLEAADMIVGQMDPPGSYLTKLPRKRYRANGIIKGINQ